MGCLEDLKVWKGFYPFLRSGRSPSTAEIFMIFTLPCSYYTLYLFLISLHLTLASKTYKYPRTPMYYDTMWSAHCVLLHLFHAICISFSMACVQWSLLYLLNQCSLLCEVQIDFLLIYLFIILVFSSILEAPWMHFFSVLCPLVPGTVLQIGCQYLTDEEIDNDIPLIMSWM